MCQRSVYFQCFKIKIAIFLDLKSINQLENQQNMADKNTVGSPKASRFNIGKGIKDAVTSVSKTVGSVVPNLHAYV